MATLNLGKLKFNWRGNWVTETAYAVDDVVFDNGTSWIVTTAVAATNTTRPESSASFAVMAPGFNFRGDFDDTADYFENDVVTHDSAVFLATADNDPASGNEPNTSPLNSSWDEIVPAPENNVLTTIGDLLYRDNTGANARLAVGAEGAGLTVQQDPRESIPSRAIRYDEPSNNHGRARDQNDQADATTTFGSTDNNGVIFCTRGLTYTITVEVASSTRNYNLHTDASGEATNLLGTDHAGSANANVTNGSGTLNFQPDASTPDDVYIRDHNNSGRNVRIRVVDMALCPSWGAAPTEDSLVLDDTDGSHTFTIATPNLTANRTWTLPSAAPTALHYLQSADTAGTLQWAAVNASTGNNAVVASNSQINSTSSHTFTSIPADAMKIIVTWRDVRWNSSGLILIRVGTSSGIVTSGYNGSGVYFGTSGSGGQYSGEINTNYGWSGGNSYNFDGVCELERMPNNHWVFSSLAHTSNNPDYHFTASGYVNAAGTLDRIQFLTSGGTFMSGVCCLSYFTES